MSDPSFVQISFKIKPDMPQNMRKLILLAFTDYYSKWFPDEKPSEDEYHSLCKKYPDISDFWRNDCYHNVGLQKCQLDDWDWRTSTTKDRNKAKIGVSITTLPRKPLDLDRFLQIVGPYIESSVCSIGYQHYTDFGTQAAYYYFDGGGNIRKKDLGPEEEDEIVFLRGHDYTEK